MMRSLDQQPGHQLLPGRLFVSLCHRSNHKHLSFQRPLMTPKPMTHQKFSCKSHLHK